MNTIDEDYWEELTQIQAESIFNVNTRWAG